MKGSLSPNLIYFQFQSKPNTGEDIGQRPVCDRVLRVADELGWSVFIKKRYYLRNAPIYDELISPESCKKCKRKSTISKNLLELTSIHVTILKHT